MFYTYSAEESVCELYPRLGAGSGVLPSPVQPLSPLTHNWSNFAGSSQRFYLYQEQRRQLPELLYLYQEQLRLLPDLLPKPGATPATSRASTYTRGNFCYFQSFYVNQEQLRLLPELLPIPGATQATSIASTYIRGNS